MYSFTPIKLIRAKIRLKLIKHQSPLIDTSLLNKLLQDSINIVLFLTIPIKPRERKVGAVMVAVNKNLYIPSIILSYLKLK